MCVCVQKVGGGGGGGRYFLEEMFVTMFVLHRPKGQDHISFPEETKLVSPMKMSKVV